MNVNSEIRPTTPISTVTANYARCFVRVLGDGTISRVTTNSTAYNDIPLNAELVWKRR